jgi:hypothetical protein
MRRAIFLGLFALLAGALPAGASDPGANAGAGQLADAFWVDLHAGTFFFAEGSRLVSDGTPTSYVAVGRGTCTKHRLGGRGMLIACVGHGVGKEASVDEFFVDPALRSATLDAKIAGQRHVVEWSSDEVPGLNWNTGLAAYGAEADLTIGAFAQAQGTVFGKKVETSSFEDMAFLVEGGGALVYTVVVNRSDGTVDVELRYRI